MSFDGNQHAPDDIGALDLSTPRDQWFRLRDNADERPGVGV